LLSSKTTGNEAETEEYAKNKAKHFGASSKFICLAASDTCSNSPPDDTYYMTYEPVEGEIA